MATNYAYTDDSQNRGLVYVDVYPQYDDASSNYSDVVLRSGLFDGNGSYGGYATGSWNAGLLGTQYGSGSLPYNLDGSNIPGWFWSTVIRVYHNADGTKYVDGWHSFSGVSPVGGATASVGTWLTDFVRVPYAPTSAPALSQSGGVVSLTSATADGKGLGINNYTAQYSSDTINWSSEISLGTGRTGSFTPMPRGKTYYVRTRAWSSEGAGEWSALGSIFVTAAGKRYDPSTSAFVSFTIARRWTGSQWVDITIARRWTGTQWVDLQ